MRSFKLIVPATLVLLVLGASLLVLTRDGEVAGKKPAKPATYPKRIVSLVPSNTEILYALGLEDKIVGVTRYCNYPPQARKKTQIGDKDPNLEKVAALKPDMVLVHGRMNDHLLTRLNNLGVKVVSINPKTLGQLYTDIRMIGRVTGHSAQAETIVKRMTSQVREVRSKVKGCKPKKVLVLVQPNPLWAAGPGIYVHEMLSYSKATNIAHDARPGFNQFSTEVAVSRNPQVIIVSRSEERDFVMKSPIWKRTDAVKHKAVYVVDGDLLFRAGPRLTEGLKQMAKAIHPEAFK